MASHILCIGGEDHALRIPFLVALQRRGFRVTAAGTGDGAPFARAGIAYRGYRFDRFLRPSADWAAVAELTRVMHDIRPDLVQSFDTKPNLLAPLAARRTAPVVRTINGMGWVFSSRSPVALALRPVYCSLQRLASRWTAATVFQNREDQAFFEQRRLVGRSLSRLIASSGVDIAAFDEARARPPTGRALREQLGLGDADVVVTVTRLNRQKGIPTLLEAAAIVNAARPSTRFLLVGPRQSEGPLAVGAAEIEAHAPYVIATGPRNDVPALLRCADLFAFPTEYREGIPRVLLEAGLAGLPIVTTRMPGCSDVVTDGWNGWLVPPRDPAALAARILDLLSDRQQAQLMGSRSVAFVRREFDLATVVDRYAELYLEVLDASRERKATALRAGARRVTWLGDGASR